MTKQLSLALLVLLFAHAFNSASLAATTEGDGYGANTGGNGGTTVTVNNADDFLSYATSDDSYIVQVSGTIDLDGERADLGSNTTITGVDENSTIIGNLNVTDENSNVIIKYLTITNPDGDGVSVWTGYNVFVNHITFYDCGDGCCDITRGSDYITVSYCKFYYVDQEDHRFTMILGNTDESDYHTTIHHNWWAENCDQRMPSGSYSLAHVYNNYFSCEGNSYCTNARIDATWLVESNYYDGVSDPCYYENGGIMEINDNYYNDCDGEMSESNGSVSVSYSYSLDDVSDVPDIVTESAGNVWVEGEQSISASATAGDGYVTLSWSTENIDIRNIQIYRDTDSDPEGRTRIGVAGADETSYTDSDVTNGTTYYYWVKIVDTDLEFYNSDAVGATPTSSDESSITLTTSAGDGYVTLNWSTSNIDIRNIQIMRDTDSDPDGRTRIGIADADETTYTDSDVTNGTTYYYWVKIVDTDLVSYNSDAVSATPAESSTKSTGISNESIIIKLYPNPFAEGIQLEISASEQVNTIAVRDLMGRLVTSIDKTSISESMVIGQELNSGMYIIQVFSESGMKSYTVTKQ